MFVNNAAVYQNGCATAGICASSGYIVAAVCIIV